MQPYRIGWDLTIHPRALNEAYWQERAEIHRAQDHQVACYCVLALLVLSFQHGSFGAGGFLHPTTLSAVMAWIIGVAWLLLLRLPGFYSNNRVLITSVVRLSLTGAALQGSAVADVSLAQAVARHSPASIPLTQLLLATNSVHTGVEALRMPHPWLVQVAVTAAKPMLLILAGMFQGLAHGLHAPEKLRALDELTSAWVTLVQSGRAVRVAQSEHLQGRSATVLFAACILCTSTVCLTAYACYIQLWSDVQQWLLHKAQHGEEVDPDGTPGALGVRFGTVVVPVEQLRLMCCSRAAPLLLNQRGLLGAVVKFCMHGCVVNLLCLACVWLSQLLVLQLLPALLAAEALESLYPTLVNM